MLQELHPIIKTIRRGLNTRGDNCIQRPRQNGVNAKTEREKLEKKSKRNMNMEKEINELDEDL